MTWIALTVEDQLVAQEGLGLVVGRCLGRNPRHRSAVPGRDSELDPARPGARPRHPFGIGTTLLPAVAMGTRFATTEESPLADQIPSLRRSVALRSVALLLHP